MTSSLVGSEMCIRDSSCPVQCLGCSSAHCEQVDFWHAATVWDSCMSWTAVSYTHLTLPTICSV
eukprot:4763953-Prorocentrum_lima.AAC.1